MSAVAPKSKDQYDIWRAYKSTRDPQVRDRLILRHASLVKYVAGRLAMGLPPMVDVDDLISYGVFGLMDAIDKYDPERQVKFETYAIARIRGAMLDGMRAYDWIPYSARQKARELESAYSRVEARLGRSATDEEIAADLGVTTTQLSRMLLDVRALTLTSLDETWGSGDDDSGGVRPIEVLIDHNVEDPTSNMEFEEQKRILAEAIAKLPDKERTVVTLYYYEGLTAKEISHVLGVSQSRISQLHSKAVFRLRARLREYFQG